MKYLKCLLLILSFSLYSQGPIFVELSGNYPLLSLYLAPIQSNQSPLPKEHLETLRSLLKYDLNYNGKTKVSNNSYPEGFSHWQLDGILYTIHVEAKNSHLNAKLASINSGATKTIENIPLTGDLNHDRQEIHKLADAIHEALFNEKGIASKKILYSRKNGSTSELIAADWDGHNMQIIEKGQHLIVTPQFIPAGPGKAATNCLYVSYQLGQPKIYHTSLNNPKPQRVTFIKGNQLTPAIAPNRNRIAFVSDSLGNPDLYLLDVKDNGTPVDPPRRIYGFPRATASSPTFSPDGSTLAFVSNKDGVTRIYTMKIPKPSVNISKIQPKLITPYAKEASAPCWSPNGKMLAYCARSDEGFRQIYIYDFEQQQERQLTKGPGHKENPSWAPNNLHLIFNLREDQDSSLYVINLHQPEGQRLYTLPGENRFPSWGG